MLLGSLCPFSRMANRSGGTGEAFRSLQNGSVSNKSSNYLVGTLTYSDVDLCGRITSLPKNINEPPSCRELVIEPVTLTFKDSCSDALTSSMPFGDSEATRRSSTYTSTAVGHSDGFDMPAKIVCSLGHVTSPALSLKI